MIYVIILVQLFNLMLIINTLIVSCAQTRCNIQRLICSTMNVLLSNAINWNLHIPLLFKTQSNVLWEISHTKTYDIILEREITFNFLKLDGYFCIKVIIFWLENGKYEFSRKQYIFLKHSKREFCAEFYYHF